MGKKEEKPNEEEEKEKGEREKEREESSGTFHWSDHRRERRRRATPEMIPPLPLIKGHKRETDCSTNYRPV